ncbi:response regulator transcription factor [Nocardioides sp.]|uniref:response regulator transcription factor n=1 Tax=Nocardioides sp. TaxID=35761 RepID=UPI002B266AC2|nr:response regulator transcription factor [Nocardioides sp.]
MLDSMIRVLVVDDDVQLTRALSAALQREDFDCTVAADATSGMEQVALTDPDLVVLDLRLPDQDGVDVVRRLRTWTAVPILILSGVSDQGRRVDALDAGADDFLQKPFGLEELSARMRAIVRRAQSSADHRSPLMSFPGLDIDLTAHTVQRSGEEVRLTPKEWRLLEVFVSHPGRLLTHTWLLQEVWDDGYGDETRAALRAHVRTLRAKLGDDANDPSFLRTDSGSGYRWIAEESVEESSGGSAPPPRTGSDGEDAADALRIAALGTGDVTHELNNALTALRLASRLLRPEPSADGSDSPTLAVSLRVDEVLDRVTRLAVELERRAHSAS